MARFDTSGIDDIIDEVTRLGDAGREVGDKMLMAAAEEVKDAWRASARKHNLKDTGDMIESIDYAKKPKDVGGVREIDIYPQGKDRKGVRNAEKAFIHEYGSSSTKAKKWVTKADEASGPKVQAAMEREYDKFLNGGR
jgi:HK97 gp10 family phage protein